MDLFRNEFQVLICSFDIKNLVTMFPLGNWMNQSSARCTAKIENQAPMSKDKKKSASICCTAPFT